MTDIERAERTTNILRKSKPKRDPSTGLKIRNVDADIERIEELVKDLVFCCYIERDKLVIREILHSKPSKKLMQAIRELANRE